MTVNFDYLNKDWLEVIDKLPPLCEIEETYHDGYYCKMALDKKNDDIYLLELRKIDSASNISNDSLKGAEKKLIEIGLLYLEDFLDSEDGKTKYLTPEGDLVGALEGKELEEFKNHPMNAPMDFELNLQIMKRITNLNEKINQQIKFLYQVEGADGRDSCLYKIEERELKMLGEEKTVLMQILTGEY